MSDSELQQILPSLGIEIELLEAKRSVETARHMVAFENTDPDSMDTALSNPFRTAKHHFPTNSSMAKLRNEKDIVAKRHTLAGSQLDLSWISVGSQLDPNVVTDLLAGRQNDQPQIVFRARVGRASQLFSQVFDGTTG